jgi:hypothetical protein
MPDGKRLCISGIFVNHFFPLIFEFFHYLFFGESVIITTFCADTQTGLTYESSKTAGCLSANYAFVSWDSKISHCGPSASVIFLYQLGFLFAFISLGLGGSQIKTRIIRFAVVSGS